ncbi:MAG: VTT domain-containing protein [Candidatus Yanofskybacteria bacterium]|nr:VTT domain-containing protein [Candidatus Yanofskybacteria bacterium]
MFDIAALIKTAGYIGVAAIVFTESGLLIGLFLPGDSLLFTAGFLASQGYLSIAPLVALTFAAAAIGDNVGYWLGKKFGRSVFSRQGSLLLDPEHIARAERFYAEHGPKTIVLARFVPVVRSIAPVLAGVGSMHRRTFILYNLFGSLVWGVGIPLAGYWLGASVPGIDRYMTLIVALILFTSVTPGIWKLLRDPESRAAILRKIHSLRART